ncbi:MAG: hypothetical protein ISN29_05415 [Gammaproteobacteria bacterium AqS3]|nr:hypothetical protein [Gammaproteobacteria bacterium AqS3]
MAIIFFTILIVGVIAAVLVMASKRNSPKQLNKQSEDDKLKNSSPVEDIIERIQEDTGKQEDKGNNQP